MDLILTGVTGSLGSRILISLLETRYESLGSLVLIVRKKNRLSPLERVQRLLSSEFVAPFIPNGPAEALEKIKVVAAEEVLEPGSFLEPDRRYHFIHSAGYVNLSTDPADRDEIFRENLTFTQQLYQAYRPFLERFTYISTAFASGDREGVLGDDYRNNHSGAYRNAYEASKHAAERYLLGAAEEGPGIQILRPSVLGGNITDRPNYFISKYMVFYLFAKFFDRIGEGQGVRIMASQEAKLNIVPADYAAKVIAKVFDDPAIDQLNIVHPEGTPIASGIAKILDAVGFTNFQITQDLIDRTSGFETQVEELYYETIGVHLTPYLMAPEHRFDTALLESVLPIPRYDIESYLAEAVQFAKAQGYRSQRW